MRVRIVDNPGSFRGAYPVARIRPILEAAGWQVDVVPRALGAAAHDLVAAARADGCRLLVAAGGDGTLRDVASAAAGTGLAIGLLPGGTANVFAREVGIPIVPEAAARALVAGRERHIDVGRLSLSDGRWARFVVVAGFGIDAAILAATSAGLKRRWGAGGIALAALGALPRYRAPRVQLTVDGQPAWSGEAWQLLLSNARRYAIVLEPSAAARIDDGLLDVLVLPAARPIALARDLLSLALPGLVPPGTGVRRFRGRAFELAWEGELRGELDGTPLERLSGGCVRLVVEPGALLFRLPA